MQNQLKTYNNFFLQNETKGALERKDVFRITDFKSSVILTAPHATKTIVNGKLKKADIFTGALCQWLSEKSQVSSIIRERFDEKDCWLDDFVFKNHLTDKIFLDIHGMRKECEFELAIGTGYGTSDFYIEVLQLIEKLAKKHHISFVVNHPKYTGMKGLTGRLQQKRSNVKVVQLEWRYDMRDFYESFDFVQKKTIPFMLDLITDTKKAL